jgi:hypothetical protein
MSWHPYSLDDRARKLVATHQEVVRESYKMRESVAYGLERFWGEGERYANNEELAKSAYWKAVWNTLVDLIKEDIELPLHENVNVESDDLWKLNRDNADIAIAVLIQLCDCLVWWTQRIK